MDSGLRASILLALVNAVLLPVSVESRQMCWSCQYVLNGRGIECTTAPGNWTDGEPRMKCPTKCIITAEFDAVSGDPTFFFRGCGDMKQKDGCEDNGAKHSCFYSCEGSDYCNDKALRKSPLSDDSDDAPGLNNRVNYGFILLVLITHVIMKYLTRPNVS